MEAFGAGDTREGTAFSGFLTSVFGVSEEEVSCRRSGEQQQVRMVEQADAGKRGRRRREEEAASGAQAACACTKEI